MLMMNKINIEEIKMMPHKELGEIVYFFFQNWTSITNVDKVNLITLVKGNKSLKIKLLESYDTNVISLLIKEKVNFTLLELKTYMDQSIKRQLTGVTTMLLDYQRNNYTMKEIEAFQENFELVEIGFEAPTLAQLQLKWDSEIVDGNVIIYGYLGAGSTEVIPNQLIDGTKITTLSHRDNSSFIPLQEIIIEADITSIGDDTFSNCITLKEINLPKSLKNIGKGAFYFCDSIEKIVLPEDITIINEYSFAYCNNLQEITIPENVVSIELGAFCSCSSLEKINLPKQPITLGDNCFLKCNKLANNNDFIIFYDKLFDYIGDKVDIIIPEGVTQMPGYAFEKPNINSIHFPKTIKIIKEGATYFCSNLKSITFEDFENCEVHIEKLAFNSHKSYDYIINMKTVTLPPKATYEELAFEHFTTVKQTGIDTSNSHSIMYFYLILELAKWQNKSEYEDIFGNVINFLSTLEDEKIFEFENTLCKLLYDLDTSEIYDIYENTNDYSTPDGFLYARAYQVIKGKSFYEKLLANPRTGQWHIYNQDIFRIASDAWALKHNSTANNFPYTPTFDCDTGSNTAMWD